MHIQTSVMVMLTVMSGTVSVDRMPTGGELESTVIAVVSAFTVIRLAWGFTVTAHQLAYMVIRHRSEFMATPQQTNSMLTCQASGMGMYTLIVRPRTTTRRRPQLIPTRCLRVFLAQFM